MEHKTRKSPLAIAIGTAFVTSLAGALPAQAADNPFSLNQLSSGYNVAQAAEGKCGEGKCGSSAAAKPEKTSEGKCGGEKATKATEGKCGGEKATKATEGKCGGSAPKTTEGKCGGNQ